MPPPAAAIQRQPQAPVEEALPARRIGDSSWHGKSILLHLLAP